LEGKREWLVGRLLGGIAPPYLKGYAVAVFENREVAREFIKLNFGYIATRPDLREEPHGWRMPVAVKVEVVVKEVA